MLIKKLKQYTDWRLLPYIDLGGGGENNAKYSFPKTHGVDNDKASKASESPYYRISFLCKTKTWMRVPNSSSNGVLPTDEDSG